MRVPLTHLMPGAILPEPARILVEALEISDYSLTFGEGFTDATADIGSAGDDPRIEIGGTDGIGLIFRELAALEIHLEGALEIRFGLSEITIELPTLLHPARLENGSWVAIPNERQTITLRSNQGPFGIKWHSEDGFSLDWPADSNGVPDIPTFSLSETLLGDTRIVISAEQIEIQPDPNDFALTISEASVILPEEFPSAPDLRFTNCRIDSRGFTGTAAVEWNDLAFDESSRSLSGSVTGNLFGLTGGLNKVALDFLESVPTGIDIQGALLVPYFDSPAFVRVNLESGGLYSVTLAAAQGEDIRLTKEELLELRLKSLTIAANDGGDTSLALSGGLMPLLRSSEGMQWPSLDVTDLYIDSTGKFSIKEAWLDLKELATLDLWGFHFELRRIGIGAEAETDKLWVDLSGGLRLIEQIPLALDVEGFRLTWPRTLLEGVTGPLSLADVQNAASQIEVKFDGIYLFFGVPDAVEFEGLIRFFKDAQIVGFAGDMALRVPATGFGAEAGLLIGLSFEPAFPFLYVYFGVDLPAGIPLGQSGLALKGAQGMFGLNVAPDKTPEQNWYYDWYKRGPIVGAHPTNKWAPLENALALGVGVTITTADGYVKGTRGLIVLSIPGPILIIEGRALILNGLQPNAEPPLRALAVFDGGAGTVQFNVEAEATLIADLLKAYGMLEAFFDFNDLTNWHLYLGQDTPRDRRIRADILKLDSDFLFKADAYLMIDMVGAETLRSRIGASIGFEPDVPDIDPLEVEFAATLEGDGLVTARPEQFSGKLDLSAHIKLSALGVSLRLSADAGFLTEGPRPLKVGAHVRVKADMPSPLDPVEATIEFEWQSPDPPEVESPLGEIDVHSRLAPLRAGFREDALDEENQIRTFVDVEGDWEAHATVSPVVEVDSQPIIIFKQKMNSTINSFARDPQGITHYYDDGLFHFLPTLTSVELYEHLKGNDDWADWKLIASTEPSKQKPLPGVWLAGSEPETPEVPSPRRVQLWTDNPLSSSAPALGSGYSQFLGAIKPGKSLAERLLDDYPELMKCSHTKAESVCVNFDGADSLAIEPGESWEYKNIRFDSTFKAASIETDSARSTALTVGSRSLVMRVADAIRNTASRLFETFLGRAQTHKCLVVDGYINIHFRRRVRKVRIVLCQPTKLSEVDIRVRISTRRGMRSMEDLRNFGSDDGKFLTFEDIHSCNINVGSELTVTDQEWNLEGDEGFDCIHIIRMDKFAIREICYTTEEEFNRGRLAIEECKNNGNIPTDGQTLQPGAYYRLEIKTRVAGELNLDDLPFDENTAIGEMLVSAYNALATTLTDDVPLPKNFHQICFFQTEAPPTNLRPYVKWSSPADQFERFFFGDDLAVRFLRANIQQMFRAPFAIKARIRDAQGRLVQGLVAEWLRAKSSTLFPEESVWEAHRATINLPERSIPKDNILLARIAVGLLPLSRYQFELVGSSGEPAQKEQVLWSSTFTTSRFQSFADLVQSYAGAQMFDSTGHPIDPSQIADLQMSTRVLARSRWDWEHAEVDFRFGSLLGGREGLEKARLTRRNATAAHDEKFRVLAARLGDLYFLPFADRLELYLLRNPVTKTITAAWIRSPENMDIRLDVFESPDALETTLIDRVGRTGISLVQTTPVQRERPIFMIPNSDSTQLLIFPASQPWNRGDYQLKLSYQRDHGDETRAIDHRYDRPVESSNRDSTMVASLLKWRI